MNSKKAVLKRRDNSYSGFRRGLTMLELIFVGVLVALGTILVIKVVLPTYTDNKIHSVVNTDISQIVKAAARWKMTDTASDGTYNNITTNSLCPYLPAKMKCDGDGYIYSSGFNGGIKYQIASSKIKTDGDSFKIFADATTAAANNHWDNKTKMEFEKAFTNAAVHFSTQPSSATIDTKATALGDANAAFTDGGTDNDGEAGVLGIVE